MDWAITAPGRDNYRSRMREEPKIGAEAYRLPNRPLYLLSDWSMLGSSHAATDSRLIIGRSCLDSHLAQGLVHTRRHCPRYCQHCPLRS